MIDTIAIEIVLTIAFSNYFQVKPRLVTAINDVTNRLKIRGTYAPPPRIKIQIDIIIIIKTITNKDSNKVGILFDLVFIKISLSNKLSIPKG